MRPNLAVSSASFALSLLILAAPGTSQADNLFVANDGSNTIEEFNSSGVGTVIANSGMDYPTGLAFDSSGLDNPYGLAFQPVPEPSTWAMLALGIGGVLGGLRLRRHSS